MSRRYRGGPRPLLTKRRLKNSVRVYLAALAATGVCFYGIDGFHSTHAAHDLAVEAMGDVSVGPSMKVANADEAAATIRSEMAAKVVVMSRRRALSYLKSHDERIVAVESDAKPGAIAVLTRDKQADSAIIESSGNYTGYSEKTVWTGSMNWGGAGEVAGLEALLALLLIGGAAANDRDRRRLYEHNEEREARAQLAEWRRLVPADGLYGPAEPEHYFEIYVPQWHELAQDAAHRATFSAVRHRWNGEGWRTTMSEWDEWEMERKKYEKAMAGRPRLKDVRDRDELRRYRAWKAPEAPVKPPQALAEACVPQETGPVEISERWFDFCKGVADLNASRWAAESRQRRERQEREERKLAEREQERETARARELERGRLEDLLQPGHEIVRGLGSS